MKIIGMMSGTSADGVDAALVEFDDEGVKARLASHFEPYRADERAAILSNMGQWEARFEALDAIHNAHNRALAMMPEADYVGFHGQTLNHDPKSRRSFQAGDPAMLDTNAEVIFDFRSNDIRAGGEGAPLVPIYHYALAQELGFDGPVEFINVGGVSNVSYVDTSLPPDQGLLAFDTGVGNAMSDDLMQHFFGRDFDENGEIARKGKPDESWLKRNLELDYFLASPPKSLDRMSLYREFEGLKVMKAEDAVATAMAFAVRGIELATKHYPSEPQKRLMMGGGRHNAYLLDALGAKNIDDFGLNGDMIEAEGFAYLAWLKLLERPASFPLTTGAPAPVIAGRRHVEGRV